ncbi:Dam family site-specific DNA-(adenine-N6)-methyltransferase [Salmonella enterica]|uniref:Dam family site-specific DNA-(adenine-N6)-methyltransferase n=1 Tax=Salmonella enterica TaxID=28901 RepID=UPI0012D6C76A|nr:Dam family site-specific DNA-(adenine-N6)-methyltransferase [Salmonella enterica]EAU5127592.1 Dam family site-specific DNA-(adenine-N6)-methyltransferase [Salmonella enterica subsp. enterica serovar Infantis]ECO0980635.1 Dam family site-specific DNA-(adenine-N6)-methyltransferase [Salmonella enterica subsp. enterica serovar Muenchen]ECS7761460.1 Dam family site-specific DNA-(adenine-N6)-methyltransferase [Salmonella enterica subsp. enterica serovar Poona]EBD3590300.1 Dam family site-specific
MRYGSVCSGIEAASVAWEPLGWQPAWFAEIEAFPSAVLATHWPDVTNLGDMTGIAAAVHTGDVEAPDVLVGGTPCQAFSIAGLRNGLADKRGQLSLSYVELANAIDDKRRERGEEEAIIVWENVPGVLSSKDNAFGCFIGALAGESCELQPAGGKWSNAGCVYGPSRIVAWRVLDAQFFGVAQRRRRVFVIASARKGFDPAAVLFELDSVRRDSAPRRETQKAVAALTARGVGTCGADDNQAQAGHLIAQCANGDVSHTLKGEGFDGSEDGTGRGVPVVAFGGGNTSGNIDVAACLTAKGQRIDFEVETFAVHGTQDPDTNRELAHTLGRNNGQENACIAFSYKDNGADATSDLSPTIRAGNYDKSHANSGQPPAIACAFKAGQGAKAGGIGFAEEQSPTLTSASSGSNLVPAVMRGFQVRRLTPVECERLQGFPDNHTLISWRGKDAAECPDGPRYKAIGNSMAVPVMRWIGERIAAALPVEKPTPRTWLRPFLKWAGGKYSLLPELDRLIPAGKRLIEPFVGGGSVFLNSDKHERFLLADINADLINLYQMLAVVPDSVIAEAMKAFRHLNDVENYTVIREAFNAQKLNATERAAAFLYLNRHCFNGLMRYNLDGFFNVGWGKYKAPYFPEEEIRAFRLKSHACVFMNAGFERTLRLAGDGDVVYCDPPYEPMPGTAGFTSYASGGFSWDSQVALAESCVAAHQRGAKVFISNSTAPRVIELYEQHGFTLHRVNARRSISSKGSTRETANDIVASLGI